ncbi:MAG: hypothetical protein CMM12_05450 [Rhodospirillaceae bacterium]|nr:hypothetical protein [Rhodospirillaceae bacterium]
MNRKILFADYFLDITEDVCPMTFVKVRLRIEEMEDEESLEIRLRGLEPMKNVPESVLELGHTIVSLNAEEPRPDDGADTVHRLLIRKGASIR